MMPIQEAIEKIKAICDEAQVDIQAVSQINLVLRPSHPLYVNPNIANSGVIPAAGVPVAPSAPVADGSAEAADKPAIEPPKEEAVEPSKDTGVGEASQSDAGVGEKSAA